ncbi:glycosyl hydrolase family 67 [Leptospira licerasiae]|uniref:Glycosyl hydrolase family 67 central domain protein n=1 Tax=Leptospira licerasiae str. MMD4847 TaxID=1049971 RepID=A0ABP2RGR0_9LEPT|nr:glycosyl hydrolase family 67 [Leptospira licerasiae]EIE00291.1 glycosyl hydrolase family 67 middle domain protein [Leptospira licerasiae serovar Varillal str. VAR 010]EJZ42512.1 glycosyl hydrolase family 67 central domain protein [Leptospira licerasiae str. MMD4847]
MLSLVDGSAPFFLESKEKHQNWSKAPLAHLEKFSLPSKKKHKRVRESFSRYTKRISKLGFNAISLDELCYLSERDFYPEDLKRKISSYRKKYKKLFKIASSQDLKVFITSDFFSVNDPILEYTDGNLDKITQLFKKSLEDLFSSFSEISGIVLRIGESDGVDVTGDFRSKLLLKTPKQANSFLKEILPIFEKHNKTLIFRTWTLGAYDIGDLIWNPNTYRKVFQNIQSKSLVISLKYGEGDFFRYLPINPLFFEDDKPKLLELQARREYEGFGEYPSFVGWMYERYRSELLGKANIAGISVWTQTGGWSSFKNITFLKRSSYWNELNTFVSVQLFTRPERSLEEILLKFYGKKNADLFLEFLELSEELILNLLYDPGFATQNFYLHRVRIPPILHITWDKITVSDPFRFLYSILNPDPKRSLQLGEEAFSKLSRMKKISEKLDLPYDSQFQKKTFKLILNARKLLYSENPALLAESKRLAKEYHKKYPKTFRFQFQASKSEPSRFLGFILKLFLRNRSRYRLRDKILFHPILRKIYYLVFLGIKNKLPDFINRQGMPVRELLQ